MSEQHYRTLAKASPVGIIHTDAKVFFTSLLSPTSVVLLSSSSLLLFHYSQLFSFLEEGILHQRSLERDLWPRHKRRNGIWMARSGIPRRFRICFTCHPRVCIGNATAARIPIRKQTHRATEHAMGVVSRLVWYPDLIWSLHLFIYFSFPVRDVLMEIKILMKMEWCKASCALSQTLQKESSWNKRGINSQTVPTHLICKAGELNVLY